MFRSSILVPLYVYPSPGAWDPLFKAIQKHDKLNFIVILNPRSGPGPDIVPDANYIREIVKLNSSPNVLPVGYASTSWANRDHDLILKDVSTYSNWSKKSMISGLGVRGIFLDETPTHYDKKFARLLEHLAFVIHSERIFGEHALIIHNPGAIPDLRYLAFCDISVIFEESYSTYQKNNSPRTLETFQRSSNIPRQAIACIIHSLPGRFTSDEIKSLIQTVRHSSNNIFLTGISLDYYAQFWDEWPSFVAHMASMQ